MRLAMNKRQLSCYGLERVYIISRTRHYRQLAEDIIGNWQLTTAALKVRTVGNITTGRKGSPAAQGKAPCEETPPPLNETKSNNTVWVK